MATERHPAVPASLTPAQLIHLLRRQLRRGLRASRLLDCPELVNFLCPHPDGGPTNSQDDGTVFDRALVAETRLSEAIERIGGQPARALRILTGLDDGTVGLILAERRKRAGQVLGTKNRPVSAATFLKHYEPVLVRDLAVEVWRGRTTVEKE